MTSRRFSERTAPHGEPSSSRGGDGAGPLEGPSSSRRNDNVLQWNVPQHGHEAPSNPPEYGHEAPSNPPEYGHEAQDPTTMVDRLNTNNSLNRNYDKVRIELGKKHQEEDAAIRSKHQAQLKELRSKPRSRLADLFTTRRNRTNNDEEITVKREELIKKHMKDERDLLARQNAEIRAAWEDYYRHWERANPTNSTNS